MQSNQAFNSSFAALIEYLEAQIDNKKAALNRVFAAAFADRKADHPSQLIYKALFLKMEDILAAESDPQSIEDLIKQFDDLKNQLGDLTANYFTTHREDISNNAALMQKMKIKDIHHYPFNKEKFYSDLSTEKKNLFPILIDVFKLFAVQRYLLRQMVPRTKISSLVNLKNNTLVPLYYGYIENIESTLNSEFAFQADISQLENILSIAADKKTLNEDPFFREKLVTNKQDLRAAIESGFQQIKKEYADLFSGTIELRKEIEAYRNQYLAIQASIEKKDYNLEDFSRLLQEVEKKYQQILKKIEFLKSAKAKEDFKKQKAQLLNKLAQEIQDVSSRNYQIKEESRAAFVAADQVKPVLALRLKLQELEKLYAVNGSSQLMTGTIVVASNVLIQLIDNLKEIKEILSFDYRQVTKQTEFCSLIWRDIENYKEKMNMIVNLKSNLAAGCGKQTWFNANPLWKETTHIVADVLSIEDPFQEEDEIKRLIDQESEVLTQQIREEIERYDKIRRSDFARLQDKVRIAHNTIVSSENVCRHILAEIEQEECNAAITEAKSKCVRDLKSYQSIIEKGEVQIISETVLNTPEGLQKSYLESNESPHAQMQSDSNVMQAASHMSKNKAKTVHPLVKKFKRSGHRNPLELANGQSGILAEGKLNFWRRHRKKMLIGAFIGLCLFKISFIIAMLILLPEITLPALLVFGGAMIAKFGVAAIISFFAIMVSAAIAGGAVVGSTIGVVKDSCCKLEKHSLPAEIKENKQISHGCMSSGFMTRIFGKNKSESSPSVVVSPDESSQQRKSIITFARISIYQNPKQGIINKAREFEKKLAKAIISLAWTESTLKGQGILDRLLNEVDNIKEKAKEVFEKNWSIKDRQEKIKDLMRECLQEASLVRDDFDHSFLKNYMTDFFARKSTMQLT